MMASVLRCFLYAIIFGLLMSLCAPRAQAKPVIKSSPELQVMLNKIINVSDKSNQAYKAKAYINWSSLVVTAMTFRDKSIVFHLGLMKMTDRDDELALIMGHELAHILNGDLDPRGLTDAEKNIDFKAEIQKEIDADILGTILMHRAGFDCRKGANVWRKFIEIHGNITGPYHPKPLDRLNQIKKVCDIQRVRHPQ